MGDDPDFGDGLGQLHNSRFQWLKDLSKRARIATSAALLGVVLTLVGGVFADSLLVVAAGALQLTVAYVLVALVGHRRPAGLLIVYSRPALFAAAMGACVLVSQVYTSSVPA